MHVKNWNVVQCYNIILYHVVAYDLRTSRRSKPSSRSLLVVKSNSNSAIKQTKYCVSEMVTTDIMMLVLVLILIMLTYLLVGEQSYTW